MGIFDILLITIWPQNMPNPAQNIILFFIECNYTSASRHIFTILPLNGKGGLVENIGVRRLNYTSCTPFVCWF